jgi:hypothetical protein
MSTIRKGFCCTSVLAFLFAVIAVSTPARAQDDDPPGRVARLGYIEGSVSFQPAGEDDWVGAVPNRPMTTGDKLWADQDSRAEVQLGSAVIRLAPMTGFSFLNLDDHTIQIQLTSGAINVTVRRLGDNDDVEVDTPNLAFTVFQTGHYRLETNENGDNTTISVREGAGEATGNGQSYDLQGGQEGYFSGTESLYADVEQIGPPDPFDTWSETRDHRYDYSRSAMYLSHDVVGFDDLDDYGDWRDDPEYGHVWFPNRVEVGWAPYHYGHWAWISPWGWTWVDDSPWGYAPFHYGRWAFVGGRWGWIAGPPAVEPVYAPALVVFVGGGPGLGGNVAWFPLGPREVFVPSYHVSQTYMTQVNVSNTTVNVTQVTNVYRTTIINNTTTITNVTYVNRGVQGAVTAVPQQAFVSAQPVAKAAVAVNAREIASAPVASRVAVAPTQTSVLGAKAATAGHVAAPPPAVANRTVVAKRTPPPPPVPFAKQQQGLAAHPGQPLARSEVAKLAPPAAVHPAVRVAPPAKPATPNKGHPPANAARPGQPAQPARPAQPAAPAPANRPGAQPAAEPNRPGVPQPNAHPEMNRPTEAPAHPAAPPTNNRPEPNRPATPPANRPPAAQPNRPEPNRSEPAQRPATPPPSAHPQPQAPPPAARPAAPPPKPQPKPQTPEEKKKQEEKKPQ